MTVHPVDVLRAQDDALRKWWMEIVSHQNFYKITVYAQAVMFDGFISPSEERFKGAREMLTILEMLPMLPKPPEPTKGELIRTPRT